MVTFYYFEDLLLKEIAQILRLSQARVSQLHSKAVFMLRAKMNQATPVLV